MLIWIKVIRPCLYVNTICILFPQVNLIQAPVKSICIYSLYTFPQMNMIQAPMHGLLYGEAILSFSCLSVLSFYGKNLLLEK